MMRRLAQDMPSPHSLGNNHQMPFNGFWGGECPFRPPCAATTAEAQHCCCLLRSRASCHDEDTWGVCHHQPCPALAWHGSCGVCGNLPLPRLVPLARRRQIAVAARSRWSHSYSCFPVYRLGSRRGDAATAGRQRAAAGGRGRWQRAGGVATAQHGNWLGIPVWQHTMQRWKQKGGSLVGRRCDQRTSGRWQQQQQQRGQRWQQPSG